MLLCYMGIHQQKFIKSNVSSFVVVLWIKLIVVLDKLKFSNKKLNWALNRIGFKKFRFIQVTDFIEASNYSAVYTVYVLLESKQGAI